MYNGQKLTALVNIKTVASTNIIMPKVPEMMFSEYKATITTARTNLKRRSIVPIFVFISPNLSIKLIES